MSKECGKGRRKGKTFSSPPLLYVRHVLSPGIFCFGLAPTLSVSTSKMAGEHLCHCSHCKIHLVCRLCVCLVLIEERGKGGGGESLRASSPIMASKASRKPSRLFSCVVLVWLRVTPPNNELARRLEHARCDTPGWDGWLITKRLKKMYWT